MPGFHNATYVHFKLWLACTIATVYVCNQIYIYAYVHKYLIMHMRNFMLQTDDPIHVQIYFIHYL